MQVTLHKLFTASTTGIKLVAMSLLLFVNAFFTRAQYNDASVRLTFAFDSPVLSRNYMSNSSAMDKLDSLVARISDGESVNVVTFSSPEGNYAYNLNLAQKRAESVRSYIASRYPALAGRITVNAGAESWDELRLSVMSDARLSTYARTSVLEIIASDKDADVKEAELKAIPAYKTLYNNYFRGLRYAEISLRIKNLTPAAPQHTNAGLSESKNSCASDSSNASGEPIVYYSLSEDFIRPGYMNNSLNLKEIHRILSNPENSQRTIIVEGAASPEGPLSINTRLGQARAENLASWIQGQFPEIQLETRSKGEDWAGFAANVACCSSLSEKDRQEILNIIESETSPARKESLLKAHPAYSIVEKECLPYIRYARIANPAVSLPALEPVQIEDYTFEIPEFQELNTHMNVALIAPAIPEQIARRGWTVSLRRPSGKEWDYHGNMLMAFKTNLLYDAVSALNFEMEFPFAGRWSVMVEDVFPWWETGNKYCFQMWEMGAEGRYWFKSWEPYSSYKLNGLFAGVYGMSSRYDFQWDTSLNFQGSYWSSGLSFGYVRPIGAKKRLNLEFSLAVGYLHTNYQHYLPTDSYDRLIRDKFRAGKLSYFGPTKAKISLVVPICIIEK